MAVQSVLRGASDHAAISVVRVQVGLLKDHNRLQAKLSELSGLIRLGQKANWLVLEEAILEVRSHKGACAYASVDVQPLGSKNEAYTLFGRIAEHNLTVARSEEAVAGARGKDGGDSDEGEGGGSLGGLLGRLMGRPVRDEAMVITLLVACKGGISAPETIESWTDVESVLTQLCGLSPDKLMGIELLWTPHDVGYYLTREQMCADYVQLLPIRG